MAYFCTDFVDDVLDDMVIRSWIKPEQYGPDDPQASVRCGIGRNRRSGCIASSRR